MRNGSVDRRLPGPSTGLTAHDISRLSPFYHRALTTAMVGSVNDSTRSSYQTAKNQFVEFCSARGNKAPFPVDRVWLAAWILYKVNYVTVPSLKMYLAGVRWFHTFQLFEWTLDGDPLVRKVMRFVKKKYGCSSNSMKIPITVQTIRDMAATLPGWPSADQMSHNDRLFLAASVVGTMGFLRGGEFLDSPGGRPTLKSHQVVIEKFHHETIVVVHLDRPKAQWWEVNMVVRCFLIGASSSLNPGSVMAAYRSLSETAITSNGPAFLLASGKVLSKAWMLAKTQECLTKAGIEVTDHLGQPVSMKASSWRSGGVESARAAGISDPVIMAMGRWSSNAWTRYSVTGLSDLSAARLMGALRGFTHVDQV